MTLPETIAELAPLLRSRQISPVEVTQACLARIDAFNATLCAYTSVLAEDALKQAREAEQALRRGETRGALEGIPLSVKDVYQTRRIPTTWGARALAEYRAPDDATVVVRLREAGAILIGKANVDTYPYHGTPEIPRLIGPTRNPWDPQRTAGRSSGGSAAAVSARLDYGSMGSDTGGSVRIPAALCGVVGLKPTFGRVSRHGVFLYSETFDHCGPIARSVHDCAVLFEAVAGHDPKDGAAAHVDAPDCVGEFGTPVRGLRVGVPHAELEGVQPEVRDLFLEAITIAVDLGMEVRTIDLPSLSDARWISIVSTLETTPMAGQMVSSGGPMDLLRSFMVTRSAGERQRLLDRGRQISQAATRTYDGVFRDVDVIMMPTVPVAAPTISEESSRWQLPDESFWEMLARHTRIFNFTGSPAVSLPCGFTKNRMPVGLQIAGRPFEEATILRVAHAYERATRWHEQRPPLLESADSRT
jgi:aspartyl-tRNA(Asn)/glutamyl-tRNA(Gln) amidotransferase subunit A